MAEGVAARQGRARWRSAAAPRPDPARGALFGRLQLAADARERRARRGHAAAGSAAPESRDVAGVRHARRAFDLPVVPGLGYHAFSLVEAGLGALVASMQLIVVPGTLLSAPKPRRRRQDLGTGATALRAALRAQLGHRGFRRSADAHGVRRPRGSRHRRGEPAARALPRSAGRSEPLPPVEPDPAERALPRGRGDRRFRRMPAPASACARRSFRRGSRRCATPSWSTMPASPPPSSRCWSCSTAFPRAAPRPRHARARRTFGNSRPPAASRCACTRCSRRCKNIFPARTRAVWGWPAWPEAYREPRVRGRDAIRSRSSRARRVLPVPAVAGRTAARRGRGTLARAGLPVGLYQDLAVGVNPRRRRDVDPIRLHALDARIGAPPDEYQSEGPGMGTAAVDSAARSPSAALCALHRGPAQRHAARRCAAHRSRDGIDEAVLDPGGCGPGGRDLRHLPVCRPAGDLGARKRAQPLPRHRRGSRNGAGRRARGDGVASACCRTAPCTSSATDNGEFKPPERLSPRRCGRGQHARSSDPARLLARRRPRRARSARAVSQRGDARTHRSRRARTTARHLLAALERAGLAAGRGDRRCRRPARTWTTRWCRQCTRSSRAPPRRS